MLDFYISLDKVNYLITIYKFLYFYNLDHIYQKQIISKSHSNILFRKSLTHLKYLFYQQYKKPRQFPPNLQYSFNVLHKIINHLKHKLTIWHQPRTTVIINQR